MANVTLVTASRAAAATPVADPTLTRPPAGVQGHALFDSYYDLAPFGYQEQEFFVSGTAATADGTRAPYTTRIIVTRPTSQSRFNGTVVLDWVNVTAQFEIAVDTMEARELLMREGFAYVHVSAQSAGVCCTPLTPKVWDPVRYAALNHPGDDYANDMFSQIAKAVRSPRLGERAMGPLRVDRVLAVGQSQSASRLYNYVGATQPAAQVIDGFLIHGGGRKTYESRLTTKVLHLLSDLEADASAPSPTEPNYRLWEIAGAAHSDLFIGYQAVFGLGPRTAIGAAPMSKAQYDALIRVAGNYGEQLHPMLATCIVGGATMPMHYATSTAIHQLDQWVRTGVGPNSGPRFTFAGGALATDALGNTRGGIRLPPIDVPVARYKSTVCGLGGITVPLTDAEIAARYPTHADYYARMATATNRAVTSGWVLPADAVDLMRRACAAQNRWGAAPARPCPPYAPPAFNVASVGFARADVKPAPAAAPGAAARAAPPVLPATGGTESAVIGVVIGLLSLAIRRSRTISA